MMDYVNGKDDMTIYEMENTHVPNHQPLVDFPETSPNILHDKPQKGGSPRWLSLWFWRPLQSFETLCAKMPKCLKKIFTNSRKSSAGKPSPQAVAMHSLDSAAIMGEVPLLNGKSNDAT
jgi:hypothetical protein